MSWSLLASTSQGAVAAANITTGAINTTGADLIVVGLSTNSGNFSAASISDSYGNTWLLAKAWQHWADPNQGSKIYYCQGPIVGSGHTFSSSGAGYATLSVVVWSGSLPSPLDVTSQMANSWGPTYDIDNVTPTANDALCITHLHDIVSNPPTIDSGYTVDTYSVTAPGNNFGGAIAHLIQTTAASTGPVWTNTGSSSVASFASFKMAAAAPSAPLDGVSVTAYRAVSLRKVRAGHTGPCLRISRSSDSTEQDIGFSSGVVDTAAALTFVGAGNGRVVTWYDQSSFGRNWTQTAANAPYLIVGGSLVTKNGRPAVTNNADFTKNLAGVNVLVRPLTLLGTWGHAGASTYGAGLYDGGASPSNAIVFGTGFTGDNTRQAISWYGNASDGPSTTAISNTGGMIAGGLKYDAGGAWKFYLNGSIDGSGTGSFGFVNNGTAALFAQAGGMTPPDMQVQELLEFDAAISDADATTLSLAQYNAWLGPAVWTWNPADKDSDVSVSGGNLVATGVSTDADNSVRGTVSASAGKYYWEVAAGFISTSHFGVGICNGAADLTFWIGSGSNNGLMAYKGLTQWSAFGTSSGATPTYTTGDRLGIAWDATAKRIWITKNGTTWYGSTSAGNPAAGTNGFDYSALNAGPYFPVVTVGFVGGNADVATAKPNSTDWLYSAPSGFVELAAGGGVTGTLTATETADTALVNGTVTNALVAPLLTRGRGMRGRKPWLWNHIVPAAAAAVDAVGTLDATEAADVAALAGTTSWTATLDATEAADIAALSGAIAWSAILVATEAPDVAALTGATAWTATLAATEAPDVAAIAGLLAGTGTLAATEAADVAALTGNVATATITGTLAATEAADVASLAGATAWTAVLAATEAADVAAIAGTTRWNATLAATEASDTAALTGTTAWAAVLAATEALDTAAITGATRWNAVLAATEAADVAAIAAGITGTGILAATEAPDVASLAGGIYGTGTLAATEAADVAAFSGSLAGAGVAGSLVATEAPDVAALTGAITGAIATLAATEGPDVAALTGATRWTATLAATEAPDIAAIAASTAWSAVLAASEVKDIAAISGATRWAAILAAIETPDTAAILVGTTSTAVLAAIEAKDTALFTGAGAAYGILAATEAKDIAAFTTSKINQVVSGLVARQSPTPQLIGTDAASLDLVAQRSQTNNLIAG